MMLNSIDVISNNKNNVAGDQGKKSWLRQLESVLATLHTRLHNSGCIKKKNKFTYRVHCTRLTYMNEAWLHVPRVSLLTSQTFGEFCDV